MTRLGLRRSLLHCNAREKIRRRTASESTHSARPPDMVNGHRRDGQATRPPERVRAKTILVPANPSRLDVHEGLDAAKASKPLVDAS